VFLVPIALPPTPQPSPSLDSVLVAPADPAFVVNSARSLFPNGDFTAFDFAQSEPTDRAPIEAQLDTGGFVAGFARAWSNPKTQQRLIEGVIAFSGRNGAEDFLVYMQNATFGFPGYVRPLSVDDLSVTEGAHYIDPSNSLHTDELGVYKGNDYFFVRVSSQADDIDALAAMQAGLQYDAAPAYTISPTLWPENNVPAPKPTGFIDTVPAWVWLLLIAIPILGLRVYVLRSQGNPLYARAWRNAGMLVMPRDDGLDAPPVPELTPPTADEMRPTSSDETRWWDGEQWRDIANDASPPSEGDE
jgi:hypothetical protein